MDWAKILPNPFDLALLSQSGKTNLAPLERGQTMGNKGSSILVTLCHLLQCWSLAINPDIGIRYVLHVYMYTCHVLQARQGRYFV